MTVIIFSIAAISNKTCSMEDDETNSLSITRYTNETWQKDNMCVSLNLSNFLESAFTKTPRYGWKAQDYIKHYLQKACCWCYQYDNDEEHSQAIKTSINNATKYCNKNETILIVNNPTLSNIKGFAKINYNENCSTITYFICPEDENNSKTTFLEKIVQNIFEHNKNIGHIKIHSGTIKKKNEGLLTENGFMLIFPQHNQFITRKLPYFLLCRKQYNYLKKND